MVQLRDARLALVVEQLRMQVLALICLGFVQLHRDAVGVGPGIRPDAGHLPEHLHVGSVGLDGKAIVGDLGSDPGPRELADGGELITEIAV